MSMTANERRGARSAINVTPLIDVLLVLLIIFMVIQPTVQHGLHALAPLPPKTNSAEPDPRTVVISIDGTAAAPVYAINGRSVASSELGGALQQYVERTEPPALLVRGAAGLDYGSVAAVLGLAHAAGAKDIGILTPATLAP